MPNIKLENVNALTEKNRLAPKVASVIRNKEIVKLETALKEYGYTKVEGKNSFVLTFEDMNGVEFIARVDLVVTLPSTANTETANVNDLEIDY